MTCEIDIEELIINVENRPVIWDKTKDDFKDRIKTKNAWEDIFIAMIENYETLSSQEQTEKGNAIIKKWKHIRDSYIKSIKKVKTLKSGSKAKNVRKYIFHDELNFLAKCYEHNETDSSIRYADLVSQTQTNSDEDKDELEPSIDTQGFSPLTSPPVTPATPSSSASAQTTSKRPKKRGAQENAFETQLLQILQSQSQSQESSDEDSSFLKSLLPTLRKFDDEQKFEFRIEVMQLVKRIQRRQYSNAPLPEASAPVYGPTSVPTNFGPPNVPTNYDVVPMQSPWLNRWHEQQYGQSGHDGSVLSHYQSQPSNN